ncbi:hypothetical protein HYR99_12150 [Candidatus Poribacteria bacterium]|nr:hypothetical protein [Candidatus Poribacteria bacterium]
MKTQLMLLFLFLGSIAVPAQAETRLEGNLSGIEQSGIFVKSDSIDASLPVNHLLYTKGSGDLNRVQAFQAPLFSQLSDQIYLLKVTDAEILRAQKDEKPPQNGVRIGGEILAGGAGGIILGCGGAFIGYGLEILIVCEPVDDLGLCGLRGFIIGGSIGYLLGSSIGVYVVGNSGNETGSFWATLAGSILGLPLAPISATIGFNLTRRYKSPPASGTALINFSEGQMSLAVPTLSFRPDPYVDLMKVRF